MIEGDIDEAFDNIRCNINADDASIPKTLFTTDKHQNPWLNNDSNKKKTERLEPISEISK